MKNKTNLNINKLEHRMNNEERVPSFPWRKMKSKIQISIGIYWCIYVENTQNASSPSANAVIFFVIQNGVQFDTQQLHVYKWLSGSSKWVKNNSKQTHNINPIKMNTHTYTLACNKNDPNSNRYERINERVDNNELSSL